MNSMCRIFLSVCVALLVVAAEGSPEGILKHKVVRNSAGQYSITLDNGYVSATYDSEVSGLSIGADFSGNGNYSEVLRKPFALYARYVSGEIVHGVASAADEPQWLVETEDQLEVRIPGITVGLTDIIVSESWTISVFRGRRSVGLTVNGRTVTDIDDVTAVYHGLYMKSSSIYGMFDDRGMAQMMNKTDSCLGSNQTMSRAYTMGNGVALDYVRRDLSSSPRQVVLSTVRREGFETGIEDIVLGSYPDNSLDMEVAWGPCWIQEHFVPTPIAAGIEYTSEVSIMPNDYDFPIYLIEDVKLQPQMPFMDIRTFLTGIYGSPAGCLQGYYENREGTIAPTISHPDVGYSPDTNFFDPDNFISLSALMYSGDEFLIQETRKVLERTSNTMCGIGSEQVEAYCNAPRESEMKINTASLLRFGTSSRSSSMGKSRKLDIESGRDGQLMHHFVQLVPTYESIAGSEQLGPNVFWTWTCLRYISLTQDFQWAVQMFPYIDMSMKYLLTFFDEHVGMIYAPGPLWIDVLVRENYTSDSNAVMVPFLRVAADMYDVLGPVLPGSQEEYAVFAEELRYISERIAIEMSTALWDSVSDDHFITQLNPSGITRDFIDYDSNLLAVAFGAVSLGSQGNDEAALKRMKSILGRVDSGDYTHVRATWCCEIPYSGDARDCYIVGGDVCGDSVVTLARIGWADAHARRVVGDIDTFDSLLLSPLQQDLVEDVWLYERYNASGDQIRTPFYFEYPSLVAMMLRELRYGLNIGLKKIDIDPFMNKNIMKKEFVYSFGNTYLAYSMDEIRLRVPSDGKTSRNITIHDLRSNSWYEVSGCSPESSLEKSNDTGELEFEWTFGTSTCVLKVSFLK